MKICITSQGNDLDSEIDNRFGRCSYFIIADPETLEYEVFENKNKTAGGGAGIQAGQFISEKGAKVLITGNLGPNAYQTLSAGQIVIYTGISGSVNEAIKKYKSGKLKGSKGPNVDSHFGMKG